MKKLSLLILCSFIALDSYTAEIEVNGFGRVRSEMSDNTDLSGSADDSANSTSYRFQMGIKAAATKDASSHVFFQPRFNKTAGTGNSGTTGAEKSVDVHQAYIGHKISETLSLTVGRQELAYGDQLLVGSVGWSDIGRAFDGFKLTYKSAYGSTDFFSMTIEELSPYTDSNRDYDFNGIYHSMSSGSVKSIDFYYLVKQDLSKDTTNKKSIVSSTGLRVKSDVNHFDYRFEYTVQSVYGYNTADADYRTEGASQYDLELGYTMGKFRLAAESSKASEFYDQLYPTAHKWMGFSDFFKRQNIVQTAVHFGYKHDDKTNLTLSYHMFTADKSGSTAYQWNTTDRVVSSNDHKELGTEIDLVVTHKLSDELTMLVKHAAFTPGKHFRNAVESLDKSASKTFLQFQTKF